MCESETQNNARLKRLTLRSVALIHLSAFRRCKGVKGLHLSRATRLPVLLRALQDMTRAPATVVFVESGETGETLKQLVHQICQDQCLIPPVLPLEYENIRYWLHHFATEGETQQVCKWQRVTQRCNELPTCRCLPRWRRSARV